MAKGKKHYSGKELLYRRQMERQKEAKQQGQPTNRMTKTLQQVNRLRPVINKAKQRMREGNSVGISDRDN